MGTKVDFSQFATEFLIRRRDRMGTRGPESGGAAPDSATALPMNLSFIKKRRFIRRLAQMDYRPLWLFNTTL
jgi:hypothetical protein